MTFEEERRGAGRYLDAIREHWLLIAALVVVAVTAAAAYSYTAAKRYEAEAQIVITPTTDATLLSIGLFGESSGQRTKPARTVIIGQGNARSHSFKVFRRVVVITFDKDFGELVFKRGHLVGVVLIRLRETSMRETVSVVMDLVGSEGENLNRLFCVVENTRIRKTALR